ncbi:MAG: hypothetical protein AMXMBFR58_06550 [Phycisphaerae bacterium]
MLFDTAGRRRGPAPAAARGPLVRVVVERGIDDPALADGLTYRAVDEDVQVGDRVTVPLGKSGKPSGGIVVAVGAEVAEPAGVRIKGVIDHSHSRLPGTLLELARWMGRYYASPLGVVLGTMVPAAVKHGVGLRRLRLVALAAGGDASAIESLAPSAKDAWEKARALPSDSFPMTRQELARSIGHATLRGVNAIARAGLLTEVERSTVRSPEEFWRSQGPVAPDTPPEPSPEQSAVIAGMGSRLDQFGIHLLRGITGSGKTEVYLRLLDRVLAAGKSALVLVPEISLTPQTVERFERRLGSEQVAVLHSGLTASQRHRHWMAAATGRARVVVGARSAVFAPLTNVGVIVVDEEHDGSYKQDQAPRYHGRDVAIKRAQVENCPVVLGSATPSLESWHNVKAGRASLWELRSRVGGGKLPEVTIVDLAAENRLRAQEDHAAGRRSSPGLQALGPTLERAIASTLADGGQVILLLNRRGFANYVCCPSQACGWMLACEHCDAAMVLHRDARLPLGGVLVCHHCRSEQRVPARCPLCSRKPLPLGLGTQRVEEELGEKFQGLVTGETMLRVDSDSMRTAKDYFEALGRFARGQVRLLVGTQMIAKGLDFPEVRLVGVVNADTGVWMPDFRAWERTFQLVSQVAGRAGRGEKPGRVIVQTACPTNPAIRLAAVHDYVTFADGELATRASGGFPPITRMARVVCRDDDDRIAHDRAEVIASGARQVSGDAVRVDGPMPCSIARIGGQYRYVVELTASRAMELQRVLQELRHRRAVVSDAATAIDVDPISFL